MPPTGPTTLEGKKIASKNAIRHGLLVADLLLHGEDKEAFKAFRHGQWVDLQPLGAVEEMLVDTIVSCAWRLKRFQRAETQILENARLADASSGRTKWTILDDRLGISMIRAMEALDRLYRYRVSFERSMKSAMHELERRQAARMGAAVPLPEVKDIVVHGGAQAPAELGDLIGEGAAGDGPVAVSSTAPASPSPAPAPADYDELLANPPPPKEEESELAKDMRRNQEEKEAREAPERERRKKEYRLERDLRKAAQEALDREAIRKKWPWGDEFLRLADICTASMKRRPMTYENACYMYPSEFLTKPPPA